MNTLWSRDPARGVAATCCCSLIKHDGSDHPCVCVRASVTTKHRDVHTEWPHAFVCVLVRLFRWQDTRGVWFSRLVGREGGREVLHDWWWVGWVGEGGWGEEWTVGRACPDRKTILRAGERPRQSFFPLPVTRFFTKLRPASTILCVTDAGKGAGGDNDDY